MLMSLVLGGLQPAGTKGAAATGDGSRYTVDGRLKFPVEYREWIYLTSGLDMSYAPKAAAATHSVFDNVFVNPSAYRAFLKTGKRPDGSVFVLENRRAEANRSINTRGQTQSVEVMGMELHVKDAKLKGGWGFYAFKDRVSVKLIERSASCYTCHEQHGAVDTTFVQFYPTLIGPAKEKGTLNAEFLRETGVPESGK